MGKTGKHRKMRQNIISSCHTAYSKKKHTIPSVQHVQVPHSMKNPSHTSKLACSISRSTLQHKKLFETLQLGSPHFVPSLVPPVLHVLDAVLHSPLHPGCSQSLHMVASFKAKEISCVLGSSSSKIKLSGSSGDGKLDTLAGCKMVLGTASPNQAVQTFICILCLTRHTPAQQLIFWKPLVDWHQVRSKLFLVEGSVDQLVVWPWHLMLGECFLKKAPGVHSCGAEFMARPVICRKTVMQGCHHCFLHRVHTIAATYGPVVIYGHFPDGILCQLTLSPPPQGDPSFTAICHNVPKCWAQSFADMIYAFLFVDLNVLSIRLDLC